MSAPQIPEQAVDAGARGAFDVRDDPYDDEWEDLDSADRELYECQSRAVQSAAYPHMRRAIIAELIAKAEAASENNRRGFVPRMFDGTPMPDISDAAGAARWLRAELEQGGDAHE